MTDTRAASLSRRCPLRQTSCIRAGPYAVTLAGRSWWSGWNRRNGIASRTSIPRASHTRRCRYMSGYDFRPNELPAAEILLRDGSYRRTSPQNRPKLLLLCPPRAPLGIGFGQLYELMKFSPVCVWMILRTFWTRLRVKWNSKTFSEILANVLFYMYRAV